MPSVQTKDLYERLHGPVYPILPAFNEDGTLNGPATAKYVRYLNRSNVRTLMVTAGTSRFNIMQRDEIINLNRIVIEENSRKAVVIAANPITGSTRDAIKLGKQFEDMGADAIMLYYPERHYGEAII